MAKRSTPTGNQSKAAKPVAKKEIAATTPVRNTPIPKTPKPAAASVATTTKAPVPITYDMISERAYFISQSPECGSQDENWFRAIDQLTQENA
ncbi:MAG: DUF2934 domain-containing protein [Tepidisphaeraceae bacterium]